MSAISEVLSAKKEDFVHKLFPAGDFLCQIVEAEIMDGYYKGSQKWFTAYVPSIEVVDYIPTGDEDIDQETLAELENFGDWKGYKLGNSKGRWTMSTQPPGYEEKVICANPISANNLQFELAEATPKWEHLKSYSEQISRFFDSKRMSGFVVEKLSTDPESFIPIELSEEVLNASDMLIQIINLTKGTYVGVSLKHEQNDPKYPTKVVCADTFAIGS